MRKYVAERRNGYGAVDLYVDGICLYTVFAGLKPANLADAIANQLNFAYHAGRDEVKQELEETSDLFNALSDVWK